MKEEIEAIKKKLEDHEERLSKLESRIQTFDEEETIPLGLDQAIKNLSKKVRIREEQVREIFDFEKNKLSLIMLPKGKEQEITQKATLVISLGYKYCFGKEYVSAQEVRRNLAENGVSLNNFATHLNKIIPRLIRRIGKPKSAKTSYRLTHPGEEEAKKVMKEIIEGG